MRWVLFYHSLVSDWNHGNAHFLRGVATELVARGHEVAIYEPTDGWSRRNLVHDHGPLAATDFQRAYPRLRSQFYDVRSIDLEAVLDGADVVLVHEWNDPELVRHVGEKRRRNGDFRLFFHDTHHRAVTAPREMQRYDLTEYDGVLAFGRVIAQTYVERGWAARSWTWHEAADTRLFRPLPKLPPEGQLVWIGNWGDDERGSELCEFLLEPVERLKIAARVYGVRYPHAARQALKSAGLDYGGWLPNYRVPEVFAQFGVTVHVPRRPYRERLPGIPTIRVFEALACGIPLVTAPWEDTEGLFHPGKDYFVAKNGEQMRQMISDLLRDPEAACEMARSGQATIGARHTCSHRVDALLHILAGMGKPAPKALQAGTHGPLTFAKVV